MKYLLGTIKILFCLYLNLSNIFLCLASKGWSIYKIVNSLVSNFASVLFDFDLRERLVKQTDTKLLTSELTILHIIDV